MEVKQVAHNSPEYHDMVALRRRFLRLPLGLDFTPEELDAEVNDLLIVGYSNEMIVASCVLTRQTATEVKLRQMVVDTVLQKQGWGSQVLAFAEEIAREHGYKKIILHSREIAMSFYMRNGYTIVGNTFLEVGIPHLRMEKKIGG